MKNLNIPTFFKYLAIAGNVRSFCGSRITGLMKVSTARGSESILCRLDDVADARYGFDFAIKL